MIPRRVEIEGFLCYKDTQAVDLDGCGLWVFSGRNGSGKSSIFDAMTFALFGHHRGGVRGVENLIHADASEFSVAFDFDLGPERYRIRRSLRRSGKSERQAFRYEPDDEGNEHWRPVPETNGDAGLKRWVQERIGLGYDIFTSSVLLLQGGADKLVAADAAERHKILSGIVDLDRYKRLHALADDRRKNRKAAADAIRNQLAATLRVEPEAIAEAAARLADAEAAFAAALAERDRLVGVEEQAKTWVDLTNQLGAAVAECARVRHLVAESEAIGRDWRRLTELDQVLPALHRALTRRAEIAGAEERTARCAAERAELVGQLDRLARLTAEAQGQLAEISAEIESDQARRAAILERLADLRAPIQRAESAQKQAEAIVTLEAQLAGYPADLGEQVGCLQEDHDRRSAWKAALPALEGLDEARGELARARARIETARRDAADAEAGVECSASARGGCTVEEEAARRAKDEARDACTAAATILRAVEEHLGAFEGLQGSPVCDRCGQALTPDHFDREAAHLRAERDTARATFEVARRALHAAEGRATTAEAARAEADRTHQTARDRLAQTRRELDQARRDAARHEADCAKEYARLDPPFRQAIAPEPPADWLATSYPAPGDLAEGRRQLHGLAAALRRLEAVQAQFQKWRDDRTRLDQARLALKSIDLRPCDEAAASEHASLAEEVAALDRCLHGHEQERALADVTIAKLAKQADDLRTQDREWERSLASEHSRIEAWRVESDRECATLPEPWQANLITIGEEELSAWQAERIALEESGTRDRATELPQAQLALRRAEATMTELEGRIAAIPEESRRNPGLIATIRTEASTRLDETEDDRRARQIELDRLRRDEAVRRDLEARLRQAEGRQAVAETLAQLLGRDGLQRELLREAERGILEAANPILGEVSGGELQLRLAEGDKADAEPALTLEAIVRTHGQTRTIGVPYLSGSQKFRVAVSLALGIGQFARGSDRPIQTVIIDEGFGCLDRQGCNEMIVELNALKGRLARIILVSHQEEIADAFADGYRFEIIEGATRVQPFHR